MNKELVRQLYDRAALNCTDSKAWVWEEEFARQVVLEAINFLQFAPTLYPRATDEAVYKLQQHFGVRK